MIDKNAEIAIIGLGLIGGSYAEALSQAGYPVIGIDIDEKAVEYALERNWIVSGSSDPDTIGSCSLVISALYPDAFVQWVRKNRNAFKKDAILTDVTGVKRAVISQVNEALRDDVEFIATHPMAGRESRGIGYADSSQFAGANFIIVPTPRNTDRAVETAIQLAEILGFQRISVLTPEQHDRIIGFVSQLCHVIAVSLMNITDDPRLVEYTGDSFRDLTRIAQINEDLWPQLFIANKDNLMSEIDNLISQMEIMKKLIEVEDVEAMKKLMKQAGERRSRFEKPQ